jgi:hypothetical protein
MNTERVSGFYWVQCKHDLQWTIAEYRDNDQSNALKSWVLPGDRICRQDDYFFDIDEREVLMGVDSYYDDKLRSRSGGCLPVVILMVVFVVGFIISLFF